MCFIMDLGAEKVNSLGAGLHLDMFHSILTCIADATNSLEISETVIYLESRSSKFNIILWGFISVPQMQFRVIIIVKHHSNPY